MKYPFKQKRISSNVLLREFSKSVKSNELAWHRDQRDRVVEVVSGTGWKFQRDNQLPLMLHEGDSIEIPAGEYHRLIKGENNLIVRILEKKEKMKITKQQLRKIIKEAVSTYGPIHGREAKLARETKFAEDIFGDRILVTAEGDGEVVIDAGHIEHAEDMHQYWIKVWPDGSIEGNGIIHTGIYI